MKRNKSGYREERQSASTGSKENRQEQTISGGRPSRVKALHANVGNQAVQTLAEQGRCRGDQIESETERPPRREPSPVPSLSESIGRSVRQREPTATRSVVTEDGIRPEFEVARSDDRFEREAARVAEAMMGASGGEEPSAVPGRITAGSQLSRRPLGGETVQRETTRSSRDGIDVRTEDRVWSLRGVGRPLPEAVGPVLESRFDRNFGDVRIHGGAAAAEMARGVDAVAFTVGSDIVLGRDAARPDTPAGQRLLAHELTHVLQQRRGAQRLQRQQSSPEGASRQASPASGEPVVDMRIDAASGRMAVVVNGTIIAEAMAPGDRPAGGKVRSIWEADAGSLLLEIVVTEGTEVELVPGGREALGEYISEVDVRTTTTPVEPIQVDVQPEPEGGGTGTGETAPGAGRERARSGGGWSSVSEWAHGALDVAGFVPGVGEVADGANALIYTVEGRHAEAAISAAAMIPVLGDVGKGAKWGVKAGKEVAESSGTRAAKETAEQGIKRLPIKIEGTKGLDHSFGKHAQEWFGGTVKESTHMEKWKSLIERAAESKQMVRWPIREDGEMIEAVGKHARIEGKDFFAVFIAEGPRAGELATAYPPKQDTLSAIFRKLKEQ